MKADFSNMKNKISMMQKEDIKYGERQKPKQNNGKKEKHRVDYKNMNFKDMEMDDF